MKSTSNKNTYDFIESNEHKPSSNRVREGNQDYLKDSMIPRTTIVIETSHIQSQKFDLDSKISQKPAKIPVKQFLANPETVNLNRKQMPEPAEETKTDKDFNKKLMKQTNKKIRPIMPSKSVPKIEILKPGMTESEKKIYGNRCPNGYSKQNLLGKGGGALVWLAIHIETNQSYALKQFPKSQDSLNTAKTEIQIFTKINSQSTQAHLGHDSISHLVEEINEK